MSAADSEKLGQRLIEISKQKSPDGRPKFAKEEVQDALAVLLFVKGAETLNEDRDGQRILNVFFSRHGIMPSDSDQQVQEKTAEFIRDGLRHDLVRVLAAEISLTEQQVVSALDAASAKQAQAVRAFIGASGCRTPVSEGDGIRTKAKASGLDGQLFKNFAAERMRMEQPRRKLPPKKPS